MNCRIIRLEQGSWWRMMGLPMAQSSLKNRRGAVGTTLAYAWPYKSRLWSPFS